VGDLRHLLEIGASVAAAPSDDVAPELTSALRVAQPRANMMSVTATGIGAVHFVCAS